MSHQQTTHARTRRLHETIGALGLATLLATLAVAGPARADNVIVSFGIDAAGSSLSVPATATRCPVSVPLGSDGLVLLANAKSQRCISSYEVVPRHDIDGKPVPGHAVRCINSVCGPTGGGGGWDAVENGNPYSPNNWYANNGLEGFHADQGDSVVFSFYPPFPFCPCL
jgi:hypothetical protein